MSPLSLIFRKTMQSTEVTLDMEGHALSLGATAITPLKWRNRHRSHALRPHGHSLDGGNHRRKGATKKKRPLWLGETAYTWTKHVEADWPIVRR